MIPLIDLGPGYSIPRLIAGGWQLSLGHSSGPADREVSFSLWDQCLDRGFTTFDCADIYTGVEESIGEFRRRRIRRGQAPPQVHTKFVPDLAALPTIDRGYVTRIIDRSLRRLAADRLDLVQFHWWDYAVDRYRETLGWLDDLRRDGKIGLLGLTNFDTIRLRELAATGIPLASIQLQYSVLDQRPARTMAPAAEGAGIAMLCFGSVAGGFLSDRWLGRAQPTDPENRSLVKYQLVIDDIGGWDRFQSILRALRAVADRHDATIARVATRFVLDQPGVGALVVGIRSADHLADLEAVARLRLSAEDRAAIDASTGPAPGPPGDVYTAEREPGGRHASIMRYDLNASAAD
jgi:aryl-alcohol dehydrogenase-like predicted oxidoreductase